MERPSWAPGDVDIEQPSIARVYDYMLGGYHNFDVDRTVGEQSMRHVPEIRAMARANREFLGRAVRFCVGAGVTQFLDVGSGIPTAGNVHEVAQQASDKARVVYVDIDPVAVSHSRAILGDDPRTAAIQGDLYQPEQVLAHPEVRRVLDLSQPVAVMMVFVLHFVPDSDDPAGIVERFRRGLAPGSHLIVSTAAEDALSQQRAGRAREVYEQSVAKLAYRGRAGVAALFGGFEVLEPGVMPVDEWRPEPNGWPEQPRLWPAPFAYAGVGRTP